MEKSIICFAPNDWWGMNPSCATHYMKCFANDGYTVLFINPFSSDMAGKKSGFIQRLTRKIKSLSKFLQKVSPSMYVYSPVFLPFHGHRIVDGINNAFIKAQMRIVCAKCGIVRPILWMENPRAADLMDFIDSSVVIFHVSDHFSKCRYIKNLAALEKRERELSEKSDLIVCVSHALYDNKQEFGNVHYLPHGVDFEEFQDKSINREIPEILQGIPGPIVGYYGTLSTSNDIELWEYCAEALPTCTFVFAGKVTGGDYSALFSKNNVRYLGMLPYDQIPSLCASFDVCMQQWKMTDWIRACNPLKTLEYFAAGKPVVSVPIDQIVDEYSDIVSIADGKERFAEAIAWELENDTVSRKNKRIQIAAQHSWTSNYQTLLGWVNQAIEGKN